MMSALTATQAPIQYFWRLRRSQRAHNAAKGNSLRSMAPAQLRLASIATLASILKVLALLPTRIVLIAMRASTQRWKGPIRRNSALTAKLENIYRILVRIFQVHAQIARKAHIQHKLERLRT